MGQLENGWSCALRDTAVRWTPRVVNRRQMRELWSF